MTSAAVEKATGSGWGEWLATLDQAASQQAVFGIQAALKMINGEKPGVDADNVIQTPVELVKQP